MTVSVLNLQYSVERDNRLLLSFSFLNCEVRVSKVANAGGADLLNVARSTSVSVGYHVIVRVFALVPTESIEHVLEWVDHRVSSTASVTRLGSTKPLLVRL